MAGDHIQFLKGDKMIQPILILLALFVGGLAFLGLTYWAWNAEHKLLPVAILVLFLAVYCLGSFAALNWAASKGYLNLNPTPVVEDMPVYIPPIRLDAPVLPTPGASVPSESAAPAVDTTGLTFIDWDPCKNGPNTGLQINYLEENGDYRSSSFMALPLNLAEVSSGMRYRAPAPAGSDIHAFTAVNDGNRNGDGYTYEVVGGDNVIFVSTAYTIWCPDLAHKTDHAGLSQVLDALHLPNPNPVYGGLWLPLPASGFIPFPK